MPNFTGMLTSNEIYNAMYNMIISQRVFDITTAEPTLANALRVDGTLYGDTKLYHSIDIGASYDWLNDAEAAKLLQINRNRTQVTQKIKLDKFRQTNVTTDEYLTKRAFMLEGTFGEFNGVLISSLNGVKRVYDNGLINCFVGTETSEAEINEVEINPASLGPAVATTKDQEALNRLTTQSIAEKTADLMVDIADNSRAYNELGFLRAVPISELVFVWNANIYNKILKTDLPTIFNREGLEPLAQYVLPARYFGDKNAGTATGNTLPKLTKDKANAGAGRLVPGAGVNGAIRSLIEQDLTYTPAGGGAAVDIHYFPGDAIATGSVAPEGTTYTQDSVNKIAKVFPLEAIPFMSSFEVGSSFHNSRALAMNNYLTWGHNTVERIEEKPFISINFLPAA